MTMVFIMVCLVSLVSGSALADELAFERLMTAKCLRCEFDRGAIASWESGRVKVKLGRWKSGDPVIIDAIELKTGKARIIGGQGASEVFVLRTPVGITFIEQTGFGNLVFRTIFAEYKEGTIDFIAVMSRHMDLPGGPLNSQYHGTCRVLERR